MSQPEMIAALLAAQKEFTTVPKNQTATVRMKSGGQYSYKFAGLPAIMDMALPILHMINKIFARAKFFCDNLCNLFISVLV